jgi:hypothetical protein
VKGLLLARWRIPATVRCALLVLTVWAQTAAAWAQARGGPPPPPSKSYVMPYVLVVLCIALGLLVVCRSGSRSNEPKQDVPK